MTLTYQQQRDLKIWASVLAVGLVPRDLAEALISLIKDLRHLPEAFSLLLAMAGAIDQPSLVRQLRLAKVGPQPAVDFALDYQGTHVVYGTQPLGEIKLVFKATLPGELQARLAVESTIDRFLEFLQKAHKIVVLDESDRHVQLFIPKIPDLEATPLNTLWQQFVTQVLFSTHGQPRHQLPGLMQSFVAMLKSVTLSSRGFSALEVPIITRDQANLLAAWYFAVWKYAKKRQEERLGKIQALQRELEDESLAEKDARAKAKQISDAEAMQEKEDKKYQENFQKAFGKLLDSHQATYQELAVIETQLQGETSKAALKKLAKQQEKLRAGLIFSQAQIEAWQPIHQQTGGDPFLFVAQDMEAHPEQFATVQSLAHSFNKMAVDQIAGVKGDIFAKCIIEMYRLMNITNEQLSESISPLLVEQPTFQVREPGDDHAGFCYACGVALDSKTAEWQVRRLIFESPEQRRQSATSRGRPHICPSCAGLAFASPLKLTGESIILRLTPASGQESDRLKLKDYLRMLTTKELNLAAGKYIILTSEKTQKGDAASGKLGQVQYALAKVASMFPLEVLQDFQFALMTQSSEPIILANRHLIFIKGLMDFYDQKVIIAGQDINLDLGRAIRYVQQDLPYLGEYTIAKISTFVKRLEMEQVRALYGESIWQAAFNSEGDVMSADDRLGKRARLFRDVAALTGLTLAFALSIESTAKQLSKKEDEVEREVSKLIEKVEDPVAFCYFATFGDDKKTSVQARLWLNNDNTFIYGETKRLLQELELTDRETKEGGKTWLSLYADDILRAYTYFSEKPEYAQEKDWKDLTYQVRLSLYTRFPEYVRKAQKGEK